MFSGSSKMWDWACFPTRVQTSSSRHFREVVSGYVISGMKREMQGFENRMLNDDLMTSCLGCVVARKVEGKCEMQ
jgi:hypothetical protein